MYTRPTVPDQLQSRAPRNLQELESILRETCPVSPSQSYEHLAEAFRRTPGPIDKLLQFVRVQAIRSLETVPEIPLLAEPGVRTLTQRQCLGILANSFFCTYTGRRGGDHVSPEGLPSINFDGLYSGGRRGSVQVAKLCMILQYFEVCRQRVEAGDELARPITVTRWEVEEERPTSWMACTSAMLAPEIHPLGSSIDDAKSMLRVDFANMFIGGGVLGSGCVQEEIMFCVCPELIVTRLFCPMMRSREAILITGAEQFSLPRGYAGSLEFAGSYIDSTPADLTGGLGSYIVAVDALDFRMGGGERQHEPGEVHRELVKAWAGFSVPGTPPAVATGNWGCGAFQGDPELKSIIQWVAASRSGKVMHYFPWDNRTVHTALPGLSAQLVEKKVTVGEMASILLQSLAPGSTYAQLAKSFRLDLHQ